MIYTKRPSSGRGYLGEFTHLATDATVLTDAQIFERRMQKNADAEKERRRREAAEKLAAQETVEAIKKAGVRDEAEMHHPVSSAKTKVPLAKNDARPGQGTPPDFGDTIPDGVGGLILEVSATEIPKEIGGGGGGNEKPPEKGGGGDDHGKGHTSLLAFASKVALGCMLFGCLAALFFGTEKAKNKADMALLKLSELIKDMEYGSKLVSSLTVRTAKNEGDINAHTASIQSVQDDVAKLGKNANDLQGRLHIVESSVVDPQVIKRNAEHVATLQGDVNAIRKSNARTSVATAANTKAVDELKKANTENVAAIEMLKDAVASLKPKDESLLPGAKGGTVPQKGGYRLSSMTYMDGARSTLLSKAVERVEAKNGTENQIKKEDFANKVPYTGKPISFKLDPDYDK